MATYIKTIQDKDGNQIIPRTRSSAITMDDGTILADILSLATVSKNGSMSKEDFSKLAGLNNYIHPSEHPASMIKMADGTNVEDKFSKIIDIKTATITTTWVGTSAPYTQDITVAGITANDEPVISPVYSTTNATAVLEKTAWNLIGKIVTGANIITVTCFEEKPVTAVVIQIKGF